MPFLQTPMRSGDTRLRETAIKSGLKPTFTVTSSFVLWTSTRELRNFRGCHSCNGDTRLRETTTKSGLKPTFTVTSSVVLWTSTRQLRNLVDAIHASINEQLIQIYNSFFDFRLQCEVGILGFERRQQCRFPVQLCFGLRRGNLEIFVDAIHVNINEQLIQMYNSFFDFRLKCEVGILGFERRQQCRVFD
ncbi:hypothetical protein V1477_007478 [Vespula maculifrons]|uniref:Uncharacterized protein n=1 Tax=Vespula maculifrons TaxID=7453 RepID=A0ABD2CIM7_VESMC